MVEYQVDHEEEFEEGDRHRDLYSYTPPGVSALQFKKRRVGERNPKESMLHDRSGGSLIATAKLYIKESVTS